MHDDGFWLGWLCSILILDLFPAEKFSSSLNTSLLGNLNLPLSFLDREHSLLYVTVRDDLLLEGAVFMEDSFLVVFISLLLDSRMVGGG